MKTLLLSFLLIGSLSACGHYYHADKNIDSVNGTLHSGHYGHNVQCTQKDVKRHYCKK